MTDPCRLVGLVDFVPSSPSALSVIRILRTSCCTSMSHRRVREWSVCVSIYRYCCCYLVLYSKMAREGERLKEPSRLIEGALGSLTQWSFRNQRGWENGSMRPRKLIIDLHDYSWFPEEKQPITADVHRQPTEKPPSALCWRRWNRRTANTSVYTTNCQQKIIIRFVWKGK